MNQRIFTYFMLSCILVSCSKSIYQEQFTWTPYDERAELAENQNHPIRRMQYKTIQSKFLDKNKVLKAAIDQLADFTPTEYESFGPYIYEQTIPEIQSHIEEGRLSYKKLVQWYLFRIIKYESNPKTTLHSIISINPHAVSQAQALDKVGTKPKHLISGMPILLKDNINFEGLPTTAGAYVLRDNYAPDAFITKRLKSNGAIILGKANLSEWAYFFCGGCPVGYSAIGGQTLNPYGRKKFETGGSSSGSGTTIAANYAVAAIGTETSGSILSPSSKNSLVGLKPTIGLLSRSGIVPISSTLDTPGPMTKSVVDNAILLSALAGEDAQDPKTSIGNRSDDYFINLDKSSLKGVRFGAIQSFMDRDSIYKSTIEFLQKKNVEVIILEDKRPRLTGFGSLLSLDMKKDLPEYLEKYASKKVKVKDVADIVQLNRKDTSIYAPYGQARLAGILTESRKIEEIDTLNARLEKISRAYFDEMMDTHHLDAVLSINNFSAGFAAAAKYPALTVPMGYTPEGEPVNITFIGKPFSERRLLQMAFAFEKMYPIRRPPEDYEIME